MVCRLLPKLKSMDLLKAAKKPMVRPFISVPKTRTKTASNLVMAKSRVAPMKRITLLRLELLAAFITATLLHYVVQALQTSVDSVYAWSDGQIALAWIRKPSSCWKVFVANRVQEIQQRVSPSRWRFCPGNQNPADLVTRRIPSAQLRGVIYGGMAEIGFKNPAAIGLSAKFKVHFQKNA